jgi:hypothetical protein
VILPPSTSSSSSSSSSEDTLSNYSSDTVAAILKNAAKPKPSPKPQTKSKSHHKSTTMTKEYASDGNSVLDNLVSHISGDAFTSSNLNSPNHPINKFVNSTVEPFQASEHTIGEPEQPIQHSPEPQMPPSNQCDDNASDHQEHHIVTSPTSPIPDETQHIFTPPSSPLIYGPFYKPLTLEELNLPTDFALPILEKKLKQDINIDDDPITISPKPHIDLSKIKIIPLKRKQPKATIPFSKDHPFFNYNSEPNLELLDNDVSISLKRFKSMEEEVLVFPSDIDGRIRELEDQFSQSLRLLGISKS